MVGKFGSFSIGETNQVVVVVVNFIKHQNRAITGERVAARAAPSYQYAMVLVIIT